MYIIHSCFTLGHMLVQVFHSDLNLLVFGIHHAMSPIAGMRVFTFRCAIFLWLIVQSSCTNTLDRRATTSWLSTCGYSNGDPTKPKTAAPGSKCGFDPTNLLWGICPNSVTTVSQCQFAGQCVDSGSCTSNGCGPQQGHAKTTTTW